MKSDLYIYVLCVSYVNFTFRRKETNSRVVINLSSVDNLREFVILNFI